MVIEGVVEYQETDDVNSESDLDTYSGSGSGIQRSVKKFTVNAKACLSLYHGFDIVGEIYPWYRLNLIVSYWCSIDSKLKHPRCKQIDILINRALQIFYLKHHTYKLHKLSWIRNLTKSMKI